MRSQLRYKDLWMSYLFAKITESLPTLAFKILQPCCAHHTLGSLIHQCNEMLHSSYRCVYKQGQYVDQANGIVLGTADIYQQYMFFKLLPIYVFKAAYQKMCLFQSIFKLAERYHEKDSWF